MNRVFKIDYFDKPEWMINIQTWPTYHQHKHSENVTITHLKHIVLRWPNKKGNLFAMLLPSFILLKLRNFSQFVTYYWNIIKMSCLQMRFITNANSNKPDMLFDGSLLAGSSYCTLFCRLLRLLLLFSLCRIVRLACQTRRSLQVQMNLLLLDNAQEVFHYM